MAEKFYDVPGAAQILGLKQETMRRWLRTGKVRGLRLGRDWRIPERALNELAYKATNQPAKSTPAPDGGKAQSDQAAKMRAFLRLADELAPVIESGTCHIENFDAAEIIRDSREERDLATANRRNGA